MKAPPVLQAQMPRPRGERAQEALRRGFPVSVEGSCSGLVALLALGLCFRGKGDPFTWSLLLLSPLALRSLISVPFRQRLLDGAGFLWQQLEHFARHNGPLPWR